ncbi:hypothetical protein F5888DRAFT_1887281 [Russula emetica]|nr:hypothetical protein F5888DRAFT_1887281 [Russula emetica]
MSASPGWEKECHTTPESLVACHAERDDLTPIAIYYHLPYNGLSFRICCHGVNSDTLCQWLGMVAVQSVVGTSSNRAISREPERHNQWRTEVRGLTILMPSKKHLSYLSITRSNATLKFMIGEHRYGQVYKSLPSFGSTWRLKLVAPEVWRFLVALATTVNVETSVTTRPAEQQQVEIDALIAIGKRLAMYTLIWCVVAAGDKMQEEHTEDSCKEDTCHGICEFHRTRKVVSLARSHKDAERPIQRPTDHNASPRPARNNFIFSADDAVAVLEGPQHELLNTALCKYRPRELVTEEPSVSSIPKLAGVTERRGWISQDRRTM